MKGRQYLTRSQDFDRVYRQKGSWASGLLVLRAAENKTDFSRYGYSISKKVGNAVVRNLTRRRLREIMRRMPLKQGWDVVLIVRAPAAAATYNELTKAVENLLRRAKLLDLTNNEIPRVTVN
jgi:ribonuclease P protein component